MKEERAERLYALKQAAWEITQPDTALGKEARKRLVASTGLSPEGVEFALAHCLEHGVTRGTLSSLVRQTRRVSQAHVLLSSNVFVAAFRAIALALCQSPHVSVRASTREPVMAELLHVGSGGAFDLVETLSPSPGDHVWAYGADDTLKAFGETLVSGVFYHPHGSGMGLAIFRESSDVTKADIAKAVSALCGDICVFDQRGCLSPRLLLVEGSRAFAELVCDLLVDGLESFEEAVPRGALSEGELADALWHEETLRFVGSSARAGKGMVFLDPEKDRRILPPVGRYLNVTVTDDVLPHVKQLSRLITTIGIFNPGHLHGRLRETISERRFVDVGQMQRPAFDGPVDKRSGWTPKII